MNKAYIKKLKTPYLAVYNWTIILENAKDKICLVYRNYPIAKSQLEKKEALIMSYLSAPFVPAETQKQTEAVLKLI